MIMEVLVQWKGMPEEEASWMSLFTFKDKYPGFVVMILVGKDHLKGGGGY